MKNILRYGLFGLGMIGVTSCINTLDTHPTVTFDAETVWGSKSTVEGFVYAAYNDIIWDGYAGSGTCVGWEARTPYGVLSSQVGDGAGNNDGVSTELGISSSNDWGPSRFSYLRRCNMIIENVQASATLSEAEKAELQAHGRFLRGLVFYKQARTMGRFVPVTQVFSSDDEEACLIPLTKDVAESYKYVIDDLKYAADNMAESSSYGVPNRWAAKVILSRAALQAYAYTKDNQYLDIAYNAALEVTKAKTLSTSDGMFSEKDLYNPEILWAYYREPENTTVENFYELMRVYPNIKPEDVQNCGGTPLKNPNGLTFEGWAVFFPTQDLVDQYLVTDVATGEALPWYETSQWKDNVETLDPATVTEAGQVDAFNHAAYGPRRMPCPQDFNNTNEAFPTFTHYARLKEGAEKNDISALMYEKRDKRFYTAVVYDNCTWVGETVELKHGGNMYRGLRDKEEGGWYNTSTGYYWRKSAIEEPQPRAYHQSRVALHFNLARVGEAYMNLAEACLLKKMIPEAVEALNATRTTHGGIVGSTATTEAEAWADYMRERACEMVNEGGDLYFSYLRWGKYGGYANHGEEPGGIIYDLNRPVHIMQIDSKRSAILVNQLTISNAARRTFSANRYLLPIHQGWLNTRETYGIQDNYNQVW